VRTEARLDDLLRQLAPQILGALVRRYGHFEASEDAVQEALLAAATQWPERGLPESPRGWLITVASRRLTDQLRSDSARRRREDATAALVPPHAQVSLAPDERDPAGRDDTLALLFMCCHPGLSAASQIALTLRAVGGLTTAEIARAFLVPEATMAQRISRAKQRLKADAASFELPPEPEWPERLRVVLHVLYLIFNEGYTASSGPDLHRSDLTGEAIRLARAVHRLLPDDDEVTGLLALMLLTDARRPARTGADGGLVPLAEQDRSRWNRDAIREGVALVSEALPTGPVGPYQLQAAIAAVHDEAPSADETDWAQIVGLYELLERVGPNPMVTLNHAVAVAMTRGPQAGLELLRGLETDGRMAGHHRVDAVRAHLLEMAGDVGAARASYRRAARRTTSLPERRYLEGRAARLADTR
jgi:RNA polymerase sigma factor (sigma-70 family)